MDAFTNRDFRDLLSEPSETCLSLYMPTFRAGDAARQNPIRFKNLLSRAENLFRERGIRPLQIDSLLDPLRRLESNGMFWRHQSDALAIFRAPQRFHRFRVSLRVEERVSLQNEFHLTPLLPWLTLDGHFYILALSRNRPRFLACTRDQVREVDVANMPRDIHDALKYDNPEKSLQFHTETSPQQGRRAAVYHGQGTGVDDTKDRVLRYFRLIDRALHPLLRDVHEPLVLAGVEYELAIYRDANTYAHVVDEEVRGTPDLLRPDELHARAWQLLEPRFKRRIAVAVEHFMAAAPHGRASDNLTEVVAAARHGRVQEMLVAAGAHCWGQVDPQTQAVCVHEKAQPGDGDLLDYATVAALRTGGTVFAVEPARLPNGSPIAAVFRY